MSPWLITTTGWPGLGIRFALALLRMVATPVPVAAASAIATLFCSVALIRLCARIRRSTP